MSIINNWESWAVHQRYPNSGCIPTGYEMLLRAAKVTGIDFTTFQEEFDLNLKFQSNEKNNFISVANAIHAKYLHVSFAHKVFSKGKGKSKIRYIEKFVLSGKPILVSVNVYPFTGINGYHIMVAVDVNDNELILLRNVFENGKFGLKALSKSELVRIHEELPGGDDIAYLENSAGNILFS